MAGERNVEPTIDSELVKGLEQAVQFFVGKVVRLTVTAVSAFHGDGLLSTFAECGVASNIFDTICFTFISNNSIFSLEIAYNMLVGNNITIF